MKEGEMVERIKRTTTVTSKFQVTIPKEIREILDVKEGDKLIFTINDKGEVVIKKAVIVALDELSALISQKAKSQGYTEEKLEEDISKAKEEAWKCFYDR
jgi:AbrB family looped-hinge helix DNA binding protein